MWYSYILVCAVIGVLFVVLVNFSVLSALFLWARAPAWSLTLGVHVEAIQYYSLRECGAVLIIQFCAMSSVRGSSGLWPAEGFH